MAPETAGRALPARGPLDVRVLLLALGGATLLIAVAVMLGTYLWPNNDAVLGVGYVDQFVPGQPVHLEAHGVWIVRLADGGVVAFVDDDPHTVAGPLQWVPESDHTSWIREWIAGTGSPGAFYDPRLGSLYTINGEGIFGPSPRNLDRYPVEVSPSGWIRVDTSYPILGDRGPRSSGNATPTAVAAEDLPR
ncbi:MAG: hypothetical protein GEU80_15120 [Dehalococcoidia bacterium]|nr:hypothetical protein [Dehalococcoidia bacterium]